MMSDAADVPSACATSDPLLRCLRAKHIIYIGDSTVRFEYLALVSRIHRALKASQCMERRHRNCCAATQRNETAAECERSYGLWSRFYALSTNSFDGRMTCDCYRLAPQNESLDCCDRAVENRVYDGGDFKLSYFQWFGDVHQPRGNLILARHPEHSQLCATGKGSAWRWSEPIDAFVARLTNLAPTHVILNAGHWRTHSLSEALWRSLAQAGAALRRSTGATIFWRTTPRNPTGREKSKPWGADEEVSTHWFREAGWEIYDAAAVVKAFRLGEKPPRYALWFGTFKSATDAHLVPKADSALAHHVATALLRCCVGEWSGDDEAVFAWTKGRQGSWSKGYQPPKEVGGRCKDLA